MINFIYKIKRSIIFNFLNRNIKFFPLMIKHLKYIKQYFGKIIR